MLGTWRGGLVTGNKFTEMAGRQSRPRASMLVDGEGKDLATCSVFLLVMENPASGCPEGHAFCRECFLAWLDIPYLQIPAAKGPAQASER